MSRASGLAPPNDARGGGTKSRSRNIDGYLMDSLDDLRRRIDETDRQLLETLALRLRFIAEVGLLKAKGVPFLRDHAREAALLARVEAQARELGSPTNRASNGPRYE